MFFADRLTLDAPKRTAEGYMAVRARSARSGVQDYLGIEVDPDGTRFKADERVSVYRPAEEVFDRASLHSFLMKPITNDHPSKPVTAANWKDHAGGVVAKAIRDGEHVAFDLLLMDANLIADVEAGKRGLSNGYACDLAFEDGTAPDGTPYQAVQRSIAGNHVAVVKVGRAGELARIGDVALCDALPFTFDKGDIPMTTKTITFDGLPLVTTDAGEAAIRKLEATIADGATKLATAETQVATLTTDKAAADAKIATLEAQLADASNPANLRDAAAAYARVVAQGKALGVNVTDAMDGPAIKRAAVSAKLGDVAKDWTDAQIDASFGTLAAQIGDARPDTLRDAFRGGILTVTGFADAANSNAALRAARYA